MPIVVITGANGFLGSYLVEFFTNRGWKVRALVHNMPKQPFKDTEYYLYDLVSGANEKHLNGADCLIHCAYAKGEYSLNVGGTKKLLYNCYTHKVKKKVFISSISSLGNALSVYGKQKAACEVLFDPATDLIIRPGLILGNGGLFGQMKNYLQKKSLIPLIDGGIQPLQTVYIADLAESIFACINNDLSGRLTIASPDRILYKDFYTLLCSTLNTQPKFISIPYGLFAFMLSIAEKMRIKLPISKENLKGLKDLRYVDTTADLKKVGIPIKSTKEGLSLLK